MRTAFHPYLPNGISGDPVVWVDLPDDGHAILLDAGELTRIPNRKLLRVDRVVVTHTHMDHFIGFDRLLRLALRRDRKLVVTGPAGFLEHVEGKIRGYAWNLIENYPVHLIAEELDGETLRSVVYRGANRMSPESLPDRPYRGTLAAQRAYTVHIGELDHGIPVLGVALHETAHLSVNKDRLSQLGLEPGPWLSELKSAVRRVEAEDQPIEALATAGGTRRHLRGELARQILFSTPGQRIAYFTDLGFSDDNVARVVELARGVDLMICETAFLHADEALARERNHLTARQAGLLAKIAGAKRLAPFHISPRYGGRERELLDEAGEAFGGPLIELPPGPVRPAGEASAG
jgi:ribonuclease Z